MKDGRKKLAPEIEEAAEAEITRMKQVEELKGQIESLQATQEGLKEEIAALTKKLDAAIKQKGKALEESHVAAIASLNEASGSLSAEEEGVMADFSAALEEVNGLGADIAFDKALLKKEGN